MIQRISEVEKGGNKSVLGGLAETSAVVLMLWIDDMKYS